MHKAKVVKTVVLLGMFIALTTQAQNETSSIVSAVQTKAINNYKQLTAPPDVTKSTDEWLVYFGPTKEEAAKNKAAAAKRKYVEQHSPLKSIPSKRVERTTTWLTLSPTQIVPKRSKIAVPDNKEANSYGY